MNRLVGGVKTGVLVGGNNNKTNGASKRKAENSPRKMEPAAKKRSALGDLTNAVKKKAALGGGISKDKPEKMKLETSTKKPKVLTRSKGSKPAIKVSSATKVLKKIEQKKDDVLTELQKLQIQNTKLPVRQTRSSRSNPQNEENEAKEEKEEEEEKKPRTSKIARRVTRSSATSTVTVVQVHAPASANVSSISVDNEDEDNSFYQTAVSTPETGFEDSCVEVENRRNDKLSLQLKSKLPDGVIDFDAETGNDPFQVGIYAEDIFAYYRRREGRFPIHKYLDKQVEVNRNMRAILVDWMVEVQESFELNHETMYLGIKLVDIFLSTNKAIVKREQLQLVGTTALYIAAKYDERCPPAIDDFCYICDDAYPQKDIIRMEMTILRTINYDIGFPLSYRFLRRYSRCAKLDMETLTLARYILEMSLMEYDFIDVKDSMIAASTLLLALVMKGVKSPWSKTLEYYSGYAKEDIFDLTHRLHTYLSNVPSHLKTIRSKYSHKVFYEAAKVPLPDELNL